MPKTSALITMTLAGVIAAAAPIAAFAATASAPRKTLAAFTGDEELAGLLRRWADEARARQRSLRSNAVGAAKAEAPAAPAAMLADTPASAEADAVTNVQHAGVDEGGIVKVHGQHLVVLRRGRLFTVRFGGGQLQPVSAVDAFGPDIDPRGAWYDEMLVAGNTIVVIGYSYARGGSEIGLYDISAAGELAYKATYHLRSNDYYSSRNYASRLIGDKLILYSPLRLNPFAADPFASFPAVRKWRPGAGPGDFKRIAPATRIYRSDEDLDVAAGVALHTVTVCRLALPELACESSAVLGPPGRVFYVAPDSVYVWTTRWHSPRPAPGRGAGANASSVLRIPLDGSAPSALKVAGSPIDQFSFLEGDDGVLNVLVRSNGSGDGMWAAESNAGDLALLRVPVSSFSDGRDRAPDSAYRPLPKPDGYTVQARYVGKYLLYGGGAGWYRPQASAEPALFAVRYAESSGTYAVPLAHGVDRIEALGGNAVAVGSDGRDLHFTSLRLGRHPVVAGTYVRANAAQGETRSHGFFYRRDGDEDGLLGLPIMGGREHGGRQLRHTAASLLYVRNRGLAFAEVGTLEASAGTDRRADGCRASCVDWYGNARPLFLRGRIFALLGYEIVEGRLAGDRIEEMRRINFAAPLLEVSRTAPSAPLPN